MADFVGYTPGSGANVAADPVLDVDAITTTLFQKIKLDVGDAGASIPVVNALPVEAYGELLALMREMVFYQQEILQELRIHTALFK